MYLYPEDLDSDYIEIYDGDELYDEDGAEAGEEVIEIEAPDEAGEEAIEAGDLDEDGFDIIYEEPEMDVSPIFAPVILIGVLVIMLIAIAIGVAVGAFLLNPAQVGLRKFFIDNAGDANAGLNKKNIGLAFSDNYMKVVGSMFTTGLFKFLWSLLLIIPGIYKSYQWRLVPYIISEDPAITGKEARRKSAEMMNGSKWGAFVLDLSFLGWIILGALTLGILNLVFTNPYKAATDAELYLALSGGRERVVASDAEAVNRDEETIVTFDVDEEPVNE